MNGDYRQGGDCAMDVIANYEKIGRIFKDWCQQAAKSIGKLTLPYRYFIFRDVNIPLTQVYGEYSYRGGGHSE